MPEDIDMSLDEFIKAKRESNNSTGKRTGRKAIPIGPRGAGKRPSSGSGIVNSGPQISSGINGKWRHDLHHKPNTLESRITKQKPSKSSSPLISPSVAAALSGNKLYAALHGDANTKTSTNGEALRDIGMSIRGTAKQSNAFSIKGCAGPFVVRIQNLAPGTTAEDVRTAMASLGKILSCKMLSPSPTVVIEIVFETKDAADACVNTYNNKKADDRLIHVYHHDGPPIGRIAHAHRSPTSSAPSSPGSSIRRNNAAREEADRQRRLTNQTSVIDGKYGVSPTPVLYSDAIISRKGRGFQR